MTNRQHGPSPRVLAPVCHLPKEADGQPFLADDVHEMQLIEPGERKSGFTVPRAAWDLTITKVHPRRRSCTEGSILISSPAAHHDYASHIYWSLYRRVMYRLPGPLPMHDITINASKRFPGRQSNMHLVLYSDP